MDWGTLSPPTRGFRSSTRLVDRAHRLETAFAGRVLPIDLACARTLAALDVPDRLPDRLPEHDGIIAASAIVHGLTVVTRNVRDFERTGVALLDPWG
jgi:predicted nucleic acid-binding protein